ncbi:hypothetical protein PybrP1_005604 [[Pythium] brassicae (nom. inval.)]|nr:hypothetical protein PybrP1_005604 [[Pythium] brassicae (nom. inval.)]
MEFPGPSDADVDMMHDSELLGFGHHHPHHAHLGLGGEGGFAGAFSNTLIPGALPPQPPSQQQQPPNGGAGGGAFPASVEEYAALMGIKLEGPGEELPNSTPISHMAPAVNAFSMQPAPDLAKIQANTDYFDALYRRASSELDVPGGATSMTLPAGIGSGMNASAMFVGAAVGGAPAASPLYDRASELAFNDVNRMYDPSSGFPGGAGALQMHKSGLLGAGGMDKFGGGRGMMLQQSPHEPLVSQTLSPEMLSAMIKSNNGHSFNELNEDEQQAILKEEKSRERNRDHSRKSRLRKKEYVESLKHDVTQLQIYQQICEQCVDLIALVSQDAIFMYSSAAYARMLGYQNDQIIAGQTSFLDLVHPDNVHEVRSVFQKFSALNETRKFQFRIKSVDNEYFRAETVACMTDKGVVCSTRVDRPI